MMRWPAKRLGDLTHILSGFAFNSEEFTDSAGLPLVRIRDVVPGRTSTQFKGAFDSRYLIDSGDILIGMDGEFNRARWRGGKALLNQRVCRIAPSSRDLDESYLFYFLPTALKAIEDATPFVTVKHLSVKQIRDIEIPLPPLPQQRRIAQILEKADALRASRRAALAQLDTLTQSIFLYMFGDPATNPNGWPQRRLEELCSIESRLVDPTLDEYRHLLHYGPDRIERDTGTLLPAQTAEEDGVTSGKYEFDERDILYSKIRPNLNKVALGTERALCSADIYPIRVNQDRITREFLWCLLRDKHFLAYAAEFSNRANIPKINREQLFEFHAMCPPISVQHQFTRRVAAVQRLREAQRQVAKSTDALFTSLRHRAFRGLL